MSVHFGPSFREFSKKGLIQAFSEAPDSDPVVCQSITILELLQGRLADRTLRNGWLRLEILNSEIQNPASGLQGVVCWSPRSMAAASK